MQTHKTSVIQILQIFPGHLYITNEQISYVSKKAIHYP